MRYIRLLFVHRGIRPIFAVWFVILPINGIPENCPGKHGISTAMLSRLDVGTIPSLSRAWHQSLSTYRKTGGFEELAVGK
jgi:hypothetical protein